MSVTAREKQAAKEQAETAERWQPYWSADLYEGGANPAAVEELQAVVRRLTERVSELEEKAD